MQTTEFESTLQELGLTVQRLARELETLCEQVPIHHWVIDKPGEHETLYRCTKCSKPFVESQHGPFLKEDQTLCPGRN